MSHGRERQRLPRVGVGDDELDGRRHRRLLRSKPSPRDELRKVDWGNSYCAQDPHERQLAGGAELVDGSR